MSTQISLKLPERMLTVARSYVKMHGYSNLQEFIRETLREKLFENETFGGMHTYKAAEPSLAKHWLTKEEDEAWAHLQEEM